MVRFVTKKESTYVGRCIYCGTAHGKLTEEHISPFALNGLITLRAASCLDCSKAITKVEEHVLRRMWGAARAEMGYSTRNKKGASELYQITVIQDGVKSVRRVQLKDALRIIELPIFKLPGVLDQRDDASTIECISKDQIVLVEQREDLAKRLGVDEVCTPEFDSNLFARFVAKCCFGYAVERYGLDAFESIYVRSAILGKTKDIGRWVGSPNTREFPIRSTPMSGGFRILPDSNDVLVRIKLFPRFDGVEYITIVGKMKQFHADQYRLVRGGREAQRSG
ncbi:MAG TPA: hypothetical protein VKV05_07290 [Terriglobales bacterium]|nr:hypothetical protein [Terriglobales bacterium]